MTDKELIQAYRECSQHPRCEGCPMDTTEREEDCLASWFDPDDMVNRLEALLAENEHLREVTKMVPRWVSVEEKLPHFNQSYIVTACDENVPAGEGIWYSTVVVVAEYYNGCWTWYEGDTEYDLTGLVTHWMPFPEMPKMEDKP